MLNVKKIIGVILVLIPCIVFTVDTILTCGGPMTLYILALTTLTVSAITIGVYLIVSGWGS
jgi:hypothetical protein